MNRELCFCIEDKELYLEQVLVEYNQIPIFFLCQDNTTYYLVLCTDTEQLNYIIVALSDMDLYDLLHQKCSMREIFTKQEFYWEVLSGEQIESDKILYNPIEKIDYSVLPEENAYFEVLTEEMVRYVRKFDDIFLTEKYFKPLQQKVILKQDTLELVDSPTETICYQEKNDDILKSYITLSEKDNLEERKLEEWKAVEGNHLVYAA